MTKPTKGVLTDPVSADLKHVMRQLKLGRMLDTLPERLILAGQRHMSHAAFLELVLADEATRRDTSSAARRPRDAGLNRPCTSKRRTRPQPCATTAHYGPT
jgi:hypothetical protein